MTGHVPEIGGHDAETAGHDGPKYARGVMAASQSLITISRAASARNGAQA
jgi:hypothetical protein